MKYLNFYFLLTLFNFTIIIAIVILVIEYSYIEFFIIIKMDSKEGKNISFRL